MPKANKKTGIVQQEPAAGIKVNSESDKRSESGGVRFSHTAALQPSTGRIQAAYVPSYHEEEEGQGKRYRNKAKVERSKKKNSLLPESKEKEDLIEAVTAPTKTKRRATKPETVKPPTSRHKPVKVISLTNVPSPLKHGSFKSEDLGQPASGKKKPVSPFAPVVNEHGQVLSIGGGGSFAPFNYTKFDETRDTTTSAEQFGSAAERANVGREGQKRSFVRRLTDSIFRPFSSSQKKRQNSTAPLSSTSVTGPNVVEKHRLDPAMLHDVGQRLSREISGDRNGKRKSSDQLRNIEDEKDEIQDENIEDGIDDMVDLEDNRHVISFISLLGVDAVPSHREATDTKTDRLRIDDQTKKSAPFKTTNAAMLDGINLDTVDNYDESFLKLWDLDAGTEMLSYMTRQTQNYKREVEELDQGNGRMEAELNILRRRKQDGYFQIKDYEAQAAEAERRHKQLMKMRSKTKKGGKDDAPFFSHKEATDKLTALLEQRVQLLCQDRDTHRRIDQANDTLRQATHKTDKLLSRSTRLFTETATNLHRAERELSDRQADLSIIQQELNYLTEEISLYVFDDETPHNLNVTDAFRYLSSQNTDLLPLKPTDVPQRLALIEETLKIMKHTGSEQIQKVADAHDQVHFHVSRRGDIIRNMVVGYMRQNALLHVDTKVWHVLLTQRANASLLQDQIDAQQAVAALLEPKWLETKEGNTRLRRQLDERARLARVRTVEILSPEMPNPELGYHPPKRAVLRDFTEVEAGVQTSKALFNVDSEEEVWDELSMRDEDSTSLWRDGGTPEPASGGSAWSQ